FRSNSCPPIHTLHGPFTQQAHMLYSRVARQHWFVAISESQKSMAPEKMRWGGVVYNGIPMDRYPFREDKDDYLFFLGRADEEKAPHLAIEAARRAGRRLVMCATTKNERERSYWEANVEPILGDDVEVHGECPHEQKADLLARASALLFPIQWAEPFGLVMTEAMACGTPVIAWRNGSVPEGGADGETGCIVSSVEEMADAVARTGDLDPHRMRAWVKERFSAEAMVAGYERIYQQVLAPNPYRLPSRRAPCRPCRPSKPASISGPCSATSTMRMRASGTDRGPRGADKDLEAPALWRSALAVSPPCSPAGAVSRR